MTTPDDAYLWDRTGTPDPTIVRLEHVLGQFAHDGRPIRHRGRRWGRWAAACAVLLVAFALSYENLVGPNPLVMEVLDDAGNVRRQLDVDDEYVATGDETLVVTDHCEVAPTQGSRIRVLRLDEEALRLFLVQGELNVFVHAEVTPRSFQVDTSATRCIDLGCRYDIVVDATGTTVVTVHLGQVALAGRGREVYLPTGATCTATVARGAGTAYMEDTTHEAVVDLVRKLDGTIDPAAREGFATEILRMLGQMKGTGGTFLPWQLLADPSPQIANSAESWLRKNYGAPKGLAQAATAAERHALWRQHVEGDW